MTNKFKPLSFDEWIKDKDPVKQKVEVEIRDNFGVPRPILEAIKAFENVHQPDLNDPVFETEGDVSSYFLAKAENAVGLFMKLETEIRAEYEDVSDYRVTVETGHYTGLDPEVFVTFERLETDQEMRVRFEDEYQKYQEALELKGRQLANLEKEKARLESLIANRGTLDSNLAEVNRKLEELLNG